MRLDRKSRANRLSLTIAAALACATLAGCATTRPYTLPNGKTAYEARCSLWYQCTEQAKKMCPHGYRLVRGPLRPWLAPPNGDHMLGPSRLDFVCKG